MPEIPYPLSPEAKAYAREAAASYSLEDLNALIAAMGRLKVLVVGDVIIDEYVLCSVQGITSKDRTLSCRYQREESHLGGALAVARHLAGFSNQVSILSVVGNDAALHSRILNDLGSAMRLSLCFGDGFRTTVKRRYVERRGIRDEYDKLLSINFLPQDDGGLSAPDRAEFLRRLSEEAGRFDLVVAADFGHGLIDPDAMDILQDKARLLAVNCQTNSSNFGMNPITKYRRADLFTVDERELRLAMSDPHQPEAVLLEGLLNRLSARAGWVTLGSRGSFALCSLPEGSGGASVRTPAFTLSVQDTVGAGDAFYALASLPFAAGAPLGLASLLGNAAGAVAANTLGNASSVTRADVTRLAAPFFSPSKPNQNQNPDQNPLKNVPSTGSGPTEDNP